MTTEEHPDSPSVRRTDEEVEAESLGFLRRIAPAAFLFFLAPTFGEYLLGNLTFSDLYLLPFLALLYGAGALLIRESARRAGRGLATVLTLGVAYALIEEGLVDQLFFNQSYFVGQAEMSETYVAVLGLDVWLTIIVIGMHAVWSTTIPIVLVESLFPDRGSEPWLGRIGLVLTGAIFAFGSVFFAYEIYLENDFVASVAQLGGTAVLVVLLVAGAFKMGEPPSVQLVDLPPNPWLVGGLALLASSLFMLTDYLPGWVAVGACLLIAVAFFAVLSPWPHYSEWGPVHRLALAGGGILTYSWLGLGMTPETGPRTLFDQVGSVVIVCVAVGLLVLAARRLQKFETGLPPRVDE